MVRSVHIIGSRQMGGAERWFVRFLSALAVAGAPVEAAVRTGSDIHRNRLMTVPTHTLGMRTTWDPVSRWEVTHYASHSDAQVVQTYMGRATRLTHLRPQRGRVHVARLGGYYKLHPFRHAHAWVGNTRGLCDWMIQQGLPAACVYHIRNFAEPARPPDGALIAGVRQRYALPPEDLLLVHPARFVPVKAHHVLLEAFAQMPPRVDGRRVRLALLGDGPLAAEQKQRAVRLGIADRLIWPGWLLDPSTWLNLADVVVFPSQEHETFGNVILDAWSYGKPLVVTAFRGAREMCRHGQDACVVECGDASGLGKALLLVMSDPVLRDQLALAGAERIRTDFARDGVIAQYLALYDQLCA